MTTEVWTVRDRNFIFGMHIQLKKPFQMTQESMTLGPLHWFYIKIANLVFVAAGGICLSQTHVLFEI